MTEAEKDAAGLVFGAAIGCALLAAVLAFQVGEWLNAPHVKTERELCTERGGEYIYMRSGPARCFAKEAFK